MLGQRSWLYNIEKADFQSFVGMIDRAWLLREKTSLQLIPIIDTQRQLALESGELVKNELAGE